MGYVVALLGIMIMCVPETAGHAQMVLQGSLGLIVFMYGLSILIKRYQKNG